MTPRSEEYLKFIRTLPCCVCGAAAEPHHAGRSYKGLKSSDYSCVPLCRQDHRELHHIGVLTFQKKHGVSMATEIAYALHRYVSGEGLELPASLY